jgi:hypothetical protein
MPMKDRIKVDKGPTSKDITDPKQRGRFSNLTLAEDTPLLNK